MVAVVAPPPIPILCKHCQWPLALQTTATPPVLVIGGVAVRNDTITFVCPTCQHVQYWTRRQHKKRVDVKESVA